MSSFHVILPSLYYFNAEKFTMEEKYLQGGLNYICCVESFLAEILAQIKIRRDLEVDMFE